MMERRAKERLIGASILVVLIVLIVPELLSGPKPAAPAAEPPRLPAAASAPEPTRTVTVDLATSKAPTPQNDTDAADATSPPPPQAAATPAGAAGTPPFQPAQPQVSAGNSAPANAPAPPPPAPAPAVQSPQHTSGARGPQPSTRAVESAAPPPISRAGSGRGDASHGSGWSVQLGSFASRANADNLVRQLKGQGFAVYVVSGGSGAATRHRVRVGPLPDRDAAERTAAKLKTLGHASSLMSPGA
jgi:DedD protein